MYIYLIYLFNRFNISNHKLNENNHLRRSETKVNKDRSKLKQKYIFYMKDIWF